MKTNNEKWQGKPASASRDGKPFEKRDVKSILKGTRGAAKFTTDKSPVRDENRTAASSDFKKRDDNRPAYGERKSYNSSDNRPSYGEKKSFESRGSSSYGDRKPYENRENKPAFGEKRSFISREKAAGSERKPYENRDARPAYGEKKPWENRDSKPYVGGDGKPTYGERKAAERSEGRPAFGDRKPAYGDRPKPAYGDRKPAYGDRPKPAYGDRKPAYGDRPKPAYGQSKPWENADKRPYNTDNNGEKIYGRAQSSSYNEMSPEKLSFQKLPGGTRSEFTETRFDSKKDGVTFRKRNDDSYDPNAKYSNKKQLEYQKIMVDPTKPVRLNKFLANAGICSRREADEYILAGVISVNGQIVTEMGVKVLLSDKIMFHEQSVQSEKKVYLLLNKPKDCVTTSEDTHDRLTVLDLVKNACSERIYPVGRLDRNTTGVLLLTNDGDLASKLTHPKYDKKKIYHVTLDKPLIEDDYNTILAGVTLDEEKIAIDALEFVKDGDLKQVGIEIHSGQNRVVRRIFEKMGYKVIRLDRVYFAGLTKKSLPRGKYRFLSDREVQMLKMGAHK
jgi:23S rRNA pseudouridine2605 synthase